MELSKQRFNARAPLWRLLEAQKVGLADAQERLAAARPEVKARHQHRVAQHQRAIHATLSRIEAEIAAREDANARSL